MQAIWEQRFGAVKTLSDVADAMQETILAHSDDLNIGHDRMVSDFHCLWMLLRIRITVDRLPGHKNLLGKLLLRKSLPGSELQ